MVEPLVNTACLLLMNYRFQAGLRVAHDTVLPGTLKLHFAGQKSYYRRPFRLRGQAHAMTTTETKPPLDKINVAVFVGLPLIALVAVPVGHLSRVQPGAMAMGPGISLPERHVHHRRLPPPVVAQGL